MSKKYAVYGIGNALVDSAYEVADSLLKELELEKGFMTLVDDQRRQSILEKMKGTEPVKRACGGSAANTVIAVSQFGGSGFYSCKVANDEVGTFYMEDLKKNGVTSNLESQQREEGTTGTCIVMVSPDAQRTMSTYLGITSSFSKKELIEDEIKNSEYLFIEGYLLASPDGCEAAIEAKKLAEKHGVKTAITFSDPFIVDSFHSELEKVIGNGMDLVFANEVEALSFAKTKDLAAAEEALKKVTKSYVVTRGEKGAIVFDGNKTSTVEARKIDALDANGAGDMFAGAFLYGVTHNHSFEEAGKLACHAATTIVTQYGPRLDKNQVEALYKEVF